MELKPGRELDALIAEKVMGWHRANISMFDEEGVEGTLFTSPSGIEDYCYGQDKECEYDGLKRVPKYSTDIFAAAEVIGKMVDSDTKQTGFTIDITWFKDGFRDTAPYAICLAALKAVGA